MTSIGLWILFTVVVGVALAVDLGLKSHRHRHKPMPVGEAARWTLFWVGLALIFAGIVYWTRGPARSLEFLTGYIIEESLSIDNMFVFILIFQFFKISDIEQPRILKWGIIGAVIMRFILIFTGVSLLARFHWIMYVFGAILIFTAIKLLITKESDMDPGQNKLLKFIQRFVQITPFMAALIVIETTDLVFAMDSIPAVLAISNDPFIVFTSNVFAILGLRALFFLVSGYLGLFRFLRYGLSIVLVFIGAKMLLSSFIEIPVGVSLAVVAGVLAFSIGLSVVWKEPKE